MKALAEGNAMSPKHSSFAPETASIVMMLLFAQATWTPMKQETNFKWSSNIPVRELEAMYIRVCALFFLPHATLYVDAQFIVTFKFTPDA